MSISLCFQIANLKSELTLAGSQKKSTADKFEKENQILKQQIEELQDVLQQVEPNEPNQNNNIGGDEDDMDGRYPWWWKNIRNLGEWIYNLKDTIRVTNSDPVHKEIMPPWEVP